MQKKIIALAIAAAFSAPAFADTGNVSVYGVANLSFDRTDNGVVSANKVSSAQSRLGLKGSEDLGSGLSAIWQIEQGVNMDNSSPAVAGIGTRNTFLGLKGDSWGTVLLGQHDTPYKIATRGLDLFADTIADNRSLMGQTGGGAASHDARLGDVVAYISPAMSGFTVAAAYVAGAENLAVAGNSKASAVSLAGLYGNGPINASLAYQNIDGGTACSLPATICVGNNNKASAWKLGGGYTMDAFTANAAY